MELQLNIKISHLKNLSKNSKNALILNIKPYHRFGGITNILVGIMNLPLKLKTQEILVMAHSKY